MSRIMSLSEVPCEVAVVVVAKDEMFDEFRPVKLGADLFVTEMLKLFRTLMM